MANNYRISLQAILDKSSFKRVQSEIDKNKFTINVDVATGDLSKYQTKLTNFFKKFQDSLGRMDLSKYVTDYNKLLSQLTPDMSKKEVSDITSKMDSILNQMTEKASKHAIKVQIKLDEQSVADFKANIQEQLNSLRPGRSKKGLTEGQVLTLRSSSYKDQYAEVSKLNQAYKGLDGQATAVNKSVKNLANTYQSTSKTYDNRIQKVDELIARHKELFDTNPELMKSAESLKELAKEELNGKTAMADGTSVASQFKTNLKLLGDQVKDTNKQINGFSETLKNMFSYFVSYKLIGIIWDTFKQGIKQSIDYVVKMDATMSEFRYVTGMSKDQVDDLRTSFSQLGQQVGATTEEVANGALEWVNL